MRQLRGLVASVVAWTLIPATAGAASLDLSKTERCLGPSGSNPIFARWVGAVDGSSRSVVTISANPAHIDVDLTSGFQRTAPGQRQVIVSRLRRTGSTVTAEVMPAGAKVALTLTTDVDSKKKSVATSTVDSYLFEFRPARDDPQSCVLTFADVWVWATDALTDNSPLQTAEATFMPGQLTTTPLKDTFPAVAPHELWAEALTTTDAPVPRYKVGHDSLWTQFVWDGVTDAYRVLGSSLAYTFWICATGPVPRDREICLPLLHERVADLPVVVRTEAEATLTQEVPLRELAQTRVLTTAALVATGSSQVTRSVLYNGDVLDLDSPALRTFVTRERRVDYSPGVFGSADVEHEAWRCPEEVAAPPRRVAVFAGAEPQRWDVVACLYEHTPESPKWKLVAAPVPGTPEHEALDSFLFALCAPGQWGACIQGESTGVEGQEGFHLEDRTTPLSIQVHNTDHAALVLDIPRKLGRLEIISPPRLPDAVVLQNRITHIELTSYGRAEWEAKKVGACIQSVKAWKDLGVSAGSDGAATLMLRAGGISAPLGNGRWELAMTPDGRELLCPALTDEQIDGALVRIRDAVANGETAGLTMIQGGRLVGHVVTITAPAHPALAGARLMVGDAPLRAFPRHAPLPEATALYVLTTQDWGEKIQLDPRKISLDDDHGRKLLTFESRRGPEAPQTFVRRGALTAPWLYVAPIVSETAPAGTDGLVMRRGPAPDADAGSARWVDLESPGCENGCGEPLPAKVAAASFLGQAASQFHTGLAWGHDFASQHLPATEVRAYVAAPLALEEYEPVPGKLALTAEAGAMLGVSYGSGVVNEVFTSRTALPISGYGAGCISAPIWRDVFRSSPQLCFGFALDIVTPTLTASSAHTAPQWSVEAMGLTPFISLGLGQF